MRCSIGPRWACAFFFGVVGVAYGAVMSRMPALKAQTGMDDADVGLVLLCMGLGGLSSFPLAGLTLSRASCRRVLIAAASVLLLLFPCVGLASSVIQACSLFAMLGFAVGFSVLGALIVMLLRWLAAENIPIIGNFLAEVIHAIEERM